MKKKKVDLQLDLVGKTIAGIVCNRFYQLNDVYVVLDVQGSARAIRKKSHAEKEVIHTIEGSEVTYVQVSDNASMFVFHTKSKQYLVNEMNIIVEDSDSWEDSYFDSLANSFYRKDINGYWYDIDGFKMQELVFLKDDIIISLARKKSRKSLSFRNQEVFISRHKQLIQVGRVILDLNLNLVKYFGDKITGLGSCNISFGGKDVLQEIKLGLNRFAFINEFTHEPFQIENEKIVHHLSTHHFGQKRVEVFRSDKKSFGVIGSSQNYIANNNRPLQIVENGHLRIGKAELIKVNDGMENLYFDLNTNLPFRLANENIRDIKEIDPEYVKIGNDKLYNVDNGTNRFVIRESDLTIFTLDDGLVQPRFVFDPIRYDEYFGLAMVDGKSKLFSKEELVIMHFGGDNVEVSKMNNCPHDKFINAVDVNGNKLVLDLRLGISNIKMSFVDGNKLTEICGTAMRFSSTTLLNVTVEKLRGDVKRVVSINKEELSYYTLPKDLVQTAAENMPSVFAGNPFCEINYSQETIIGSKVFISASFVVYTGKQFSVILEKESGHPLHLEGNGHRNELASTWVDDTLSKSFNLGMNRMVCVNTVTENFKEHQLLFSVEKLTSWLPFFDNYLPIMRQILEIQGSGQENWDYHLFELGEVSKHKEYLAVEKIAPYRLLTDKKDSGYYPRIVKSKSKSIKSPEELNLLQRIFSLGAGELVVVE